MSSVREKVEAYFSTLSPTSERIMADMASAKSQHGEKWVDLSTIEQEQLLWRALVDPEIERKYEKNTPNIEIEVFPVLGIKPGAKIVVDEDASAGKPFGTSWRDEHSAPFHWETQSQLNLSLFDWEGKEKPVSKSLAATPNDERKDGEIKRSHAIKRPEVPPPPVPPHFTPPVPPHSENSPPVPAHSEQSENEATALYAKVVKRKASAKTLVISDMKAHKKALQEMKPAVPPRMSLELELDIDHLKEQQKKKIIPKTGFDFLDNW